MGGMVLRERIELSTSPLPRECSATELPQPDARLGSPKCPAAQAQSGRYLKLALREGMSSDMQDRKDTPTSVEAQRAARLKAALKANIAKRKAQARARKPVQQPPEKDNTEG